MVTVPLSFQTTEEWKDSSLGLHPVQVALQVALPELDGGLEPIIFSGRDSKSGKSHSLEDRRRKSKTEPSSSLVETQEELGKEFGHHGVFVSAG